MRKGFIIDEKTGRILFLRPEHKRAKGASIRAKFAIRDALQLAGACGGTLG
jgi:hypothetical protein